MADTLDTSDQIDPMDQGAQILAQGQGNNMAGLTNAKIIVTLIALDGMTAVDAARLFNSAVLGTDTPTVAQAIGLIVAQGLLNAQDAARLLSTIQ